MEIKKDFCIILVFNNNYLEKAKQTISQLRKIGKYDGIIECIIGNDLVNIIDQLKTVFDYNVKFKYFPDIDRTEIINLLKKNPIGDGREYNKIFQWHKLYCFHQYFKENYKKCFYIDTGMFIHNSIEKIIQLDCENILLAHSDAFPTYEWKLGIQFDKTIFPSLYEDLNEKYDLNIDYFQSGIMLYDTNIIEDNTFRDLLNLSNYYINSRNNEQGILNIYFNCIKKYWKQIQIKDDKQYYYDFHNRNGVSVNNYIMTKYINN